MSGIQSSGNCAPVATSVGVKMIKSLDQHEVFVFGSNLSGFHGAGSAGYAMRGTTANTWRDDVAFRAIMSGKNPDKRGLWAVYGVGRGYQVGLTGRSYAIPTVERPGQQGIVTEAFFLHELRTFVEFARAHPELTFRVVRLGANRAEGGYSYLGLKAVKNCFDTIRREAGLPSNIALPEEFLGAEPVIRNITRVLPLVCTHCEEDGRGRAPHPYFLIHTINYGITCIHCGHDYGSRPATAAEWAERDTRERWTDAYWEAVDREYPEYKSPEEVAREEAAMHNTSCQRCGGEADGNGLCASCFFEHEENVAAGDEPAPIKEE